MSNDRVGELEDEIPAGEPTEITPEEQDTSEDEVSDYEQAYNEAVERAQKAEEIANNYKKENEKYRKKDREIKEPVQAKQISDDVRVTIQHDYSSKKQDVIDEFKEDINDLSDAEWGKIRHLVSPATQSVLDEANKNGRFVARGELKRTIGDLISYAKGEKQATRKEEDARLQGLSDAQKLEAAEIGGVTSKGASSGAGITAQDKTKAKETGRTPEAEKEIRVKREERAKEYSVNDPIAKYL